MAETLSVAEMLPNKFEPKRKFRWVFAIEGIDAFLIPVMLQEEQRSKQ